MKLTQISNIFRHMNVKNILLLICIAHVQTTVNASFRPTLGIKLGRAFNKDFFNNYNTTCGMDLRMSTPVKDNLDIISGIGFDYNKAFYYTFPEAGIQFHGAYCMVGYQGLNEKSKKFGTCIGYELYSLYIEWRTNRFLWPGDLNIVSVGFRL